MAWSRRDEARAILTPAGGACEGPIGCRPRPIHATHAGAMDVLAAHAARHPEKPALLEGERAWTWAELIARRNRLGHGLLDLGLPPGGHVIVYAENSLEHYLAGAAARAAGLIPAPMNHRLVAEEVALHPRPLRRGRGAGERSLPAPRRDRPRPGRGRCGSGSCWARSGGPGPCTWTTCWPRAGPIRWSARGGEGFGASIIYTGGTTGKPKGALRRGIDPQDLMDTLGAMDLLDPTHVHLVAGPMYHSAPGGLALYTHLVGGTVVIMPKFDPEQALAEIERHRCTSTFMAPDPAQAHRGPARGGAGALRRVLDARHHHGGGAVPDEREGGRGGPLRARALRVLRLERARGEHDAAARRTCCASRARAGAPRRARRSRCSTTTAGRCRRASRASSTCAGSPASSTSTTRTRRRRARCAAATGTRWATWPTWTRTASTTSATASAT